MWPTLYPSTEVDAYRIFGTEVSTSTQNDWSMESMEGFEGPSWSEIKKISDFLLLRNIFFWSAKQTLNIPCEKS